MDESYIGTILMFVGNYAPRDWEFCDGQLVAISDNPSLFAIIGNTYGGDGVQTFKLPDLRGRFAIHAGSGPGLTPHYRGQVGGYESVTLNNAQIPNHTHNGIGTIKAKEEPDSDDPTGNYIAGTGASSFGTSTDIQMHSNSVDITIESSGGSQAHSNMPPYQTVNFIICTQGLYPPRP